MYYINMEMLLPVAFLWQKKYILFPLQMAATLKIKLSVILPAKTGLFRNNRLLQFGTWKL